MAKILLQSIDHLDDYERPTPVIQESIRTTDPQWLLVGNFTGQIFDVLAGIPPSIHLYWKLEYLGNEYQPFLFDPSTCFLPPEFTEKMLRLEHHLALYTFNNWNRKNILVCFPHLSRLDFHLQPVAQKPIIMVDKNNDAHNLRHKLNIGHSDVLFGVAGLLHEAKGIDEIIQGFISLPFEPHWHILLTLISDLSAGDIKRRWIQRFGTSPWFEQIHVRKGSYCEWEWMPIFYQAVDFILVNSRSDSWGRVVSEAVGCETPVIVRRADCGTNHIFPDITLIDSFTSLSLESLKILMKRAKQKTQGLLHYANKHYSPTVVKDKMLINLRASAPETDKKEFDRLVASGALGDIEQIIYN
ncbi:hypothetical protein BGP_0800 [Beggiatoa sp. PS]|nr:hypothetical protein BGP_0800 [Beggiatoa sp. PS]